MFFVGPHAQMRPKMLFALLGRFWHLCDEGVMTTWLHVGDSTDYAQLNILVVYCEEHSMAGTERFDLRPGPP